MPPAALRCSPGPVPRGKTHRRGYSLDAGLQFREKDDDLALFNDLNERENFLLVSTDNFEGHSSNMRYFSDIKLGISIPVQGESSGLLNADGDKNDYDWLMTPPDTPLFASLDDEPAPANLVRRGRPRSQPISISRSSRMEKCNKSSRGSASPQRSSPSPGSSSSTLLSRGRPSSAPHSSPTSTLRHATSFRRPSPPPLKSLAPAQRSSSPTPRKMSTGSGRARVSSGVRGLSPTKARAGGSVSPKIRAWQSNIPGFSSDAPPNLRTSPADRPVSYVRGSSPASRHGRDSSSRIGRQAIASSTSRSASSSHSHDRDRFSTNSKGSVALSGDDDTDSLWSLPRGCSDGLSSRRAGAFSRNKAPTFSKKPSRTCLSSSAPKRFDSSHRQMDYQKSPQNMFRPLLSNVSSTTFNEGDAASASAHQALISRNSSVTTSGIAGSDHGRNFNIGTEKSDGCRDDVTNELGNAFSHKVTGEFFVFDKESVANEGAGQGIYDESQSFQHGDFDQEGPIKCSPMEFQDSGQHVTEMITATDDADDLGLRDETCSKCGCRYRHIGLADDLELDANLCSDCRRKHGLLMTTIVVTPAVSSNLLKNVSEESKPLKDLCPPTCSSELSSAATDTGENGSMELREMIHLKDHDNPPYSETGIQQPGNFIQGQGLTVTSIASEEPSYDGDNTQRILISASSSADLSLRQQQLQSVIRTSSLENCKNEISTTRSSCSGISNPTHRSIGLLSSYGDNSDIFLNNVEYGGSQTPLNSEDREVDGSHECSGNIQTVNDLTSENSERISVASSSTYEHTGEEFMKAQKTCLDFEASAMSPDEHIFLSNASLGGPEVAEVPLHSSAVAASEIEMGNDLQKNNTAEFLPSDEDPMGSASEVCFSDHALGMSGESMVTVAGQGGSNGRNLTLEEAADAVLFCSSIIHRLVYEAAAIAIDKENSVQVECSWPAIAATAGKSGAGQNGSPGWSGVKRTQKPRLKQVDSVTRAVCGKTKSDESNMGDSLAQKSTEVVGGKPPKLESKCNCVVM